MKLLNTAEDIQYNELVSKIRENSPYTARPARDYVPLIRARVCRALNYAIDNSLVTDIKVDRSQNVDLYYHV